MKITYSDQPIEDFVPGKGKTRDWARELVRNLAHPTCIIEVDTQAEARKAQAAIQAVAKEQKRPLATRVTQEDGHWLVRFGNRK